MRTLNRIGWILGCLCLFLYLGCHAPGYKESRKYKKAVEETKDGDEKEQSSTNEGDLPPAEILGVLPITPEMIYEEKAEISKKLMEKCEDANVWVQALVNIEGNVEEVKVSKSVGCECDEMRAALDSAAVQAAYKCKYKPAIQNGKPVAVWVSYNVNFTGD